MPSYHTTDTKKPRESPHHGNLSWPSLPQQQSSVGVQELSVWSLGVSGIGD